MKNADKPAYPLATGSVMGLGKDGLTKRELFIKSAMEALLSNPVIMNHSDGFPEPYLVVGYVDKILEKMEQ